ncbi:FAD-dependent oxidoreductase, partial [Neisseria gonorrhoeae]|uniref:FAD-dependent oxidoreductase n=1 Tax=Neisseria gonorrhoeae TaxID=485 RepID=UPI00311FDFC7
IVQGTGISYNRLERGIAHYYTDQKSFDAATHAAALMRGFGVDRRVINRSELFEIEPAYRSFADHIVGGTYTASDESGDARVFTQELAQRCEAAGVQFVYEHDIVRLEKIAGEISAVQLRKRSTGELLARQADAFVV